MTSKEKKRSETKKRWSKRKKRFSRRTHKFFRGIRRGSHVFFRSLDGAFVGTVLAGTAAGFYLVYLTKNDMSQKIADINAANNAANNAAAAAAANRAHERFLKENMLRDMGWREAGWNKLKKGLVTATEIGDNLTSGQIFPDLWEGTKHSAAKTVENAKNSLIQSTWNVNLTKNSLNDVLKRKKGVLALMTGSGSLVGLYKGYVKGRTEVNAEIHSEKILKRMRKKRRKSRKSKEKK